jgi:hypothetical protein
LSSLRARKGSIRKRYIVGIMLLAFVVGLFVPHIIRAFDGKTYRITLGIIMLAMIPLVARKKMAKKCAIQVRFKKELAAYYLQQVYFCKELLAVALVHS